MIALTLTFAFLQALGAIVGAVGIVWSEIVYFRAMKDGVIDAAEKAHLQVVAKTLRTGMLLLLLSSFGLVILAHLQKTTESALTTSYWIEMILALLVIAASWGLYRKRLSFMIGTAIIFSAWWFLFFLTIGRFPAFNFGDTLAFYAVATGVFATLLWYVRLLAKPKKLKATV